MLRPVVDHVAPLAEGCEVSVGVVCGVVIAMRGGQNHASPADAAEDVSFRSDPNPTTPTVPPAAGICVPPAAVTEVVDHPSVRTPAPLTAAFRPPEPDHGRELRPVDGVEEAMLRPDWHGEALCHPS